MNQHKLFEPIGFYVAGVTAFLTLILYYSDSKMFLGSLYAALMTGFLAWIAYVVTRMIILSFK